MSRWRVSGCWGRLGLLAWAWVGVSAQAQGLRFVALGDMPYGPRAQTQAPYERLIDAINQTAPAFSIHIGDIKSGSSRCDDEELEHQRNNFNRFRQPLIYTPGDNEWTDCHRSNNGGYDPVERLQALRRIFFAKRQALGQTPLRLQAQPEVQADQPDWVENQRWMQAQVVFATVHMVGSNNNRDPKRPEAMREFEARDRANRAWLRSVFEWAKTQQARAVVLAMQADPFESKRWGQVFPPDSGFTLSVGQTLLPLAQASGVPVLLVHGDSHRFAFDQPFELNGQPLRNVHRLEVPGGYGDYRALAVTVQTENTQQPFAIEWINP